MSPLLDELCERARRVYGTDAVVYVDLPSNRLPLWAVDVVTNRQLHDTEEAGTFTAACAPLVRRLAARERVT